MGERKLGMAPRLRFSDRKVFLGLVLVAVVTLAMFGVLFWEYLSVSVTESEEAVRSFVQALDHYDANVTWGLMSTALQESYGTMEGFNNTVLSGLRQSGWHAETMNMTVRANFTLPGSLVHNSAHIVASLRITESACARADLPLPIKRIALNLSSRPDGESTNGPPASETSARCLFL